MRQKRKYTKHPMTPERVIGMITRIRSRNNRQWMAILKLAFKARPTKAKKIMANIVENDRTITRWMAKL